MTNFKGIRNLQVDFAEGVTNIYGDNDTGVQRNRSEFCEGL